MKITRKQATMAGITSLAVAVGLIYQARTTAPDHAREATPTPEPMSVRLITVSRTGMPQTLEATGVVRSQWESPVATKIHGRVLTVLVREGDRVRKGQPLIRLDARDLDAAVIQAEANRRAAAVGVDNAVTAAEMEASVSAARIAQAQAAVRNAEAAVQASRARLQLVQSGPRPQERQQASLAVAQAKSALTLAETNLGRMKSLFTQGAIARAQLDTAQSQYEVAKAQHEMAVQGQSIAEEGSRLEDIRGAQEAVRQAEAGLNQARAGLKEARAASLQVNVRRQQIRGAEAQVGQSAAAVQMAKVTRDYATINAPFDGVVTKRLVDPGSLASPGVPLMTIQGGATRLEAVVPESALSAAQPGSTVRVSLDAIPGRNLTGRVVEVAPQGDTASHTFIIKIDFPAGAGAKAGMFGRTRFRTGESNGMFVPAEAVVEREGLRYVYVADGDTARMRLVTVGDKSVAGLAVLSGLDPGESLIQDADGVKDGAPITVEGRE